ncbi:MAG: hypothetical protein R2991_15195 [Thermoanaerobaculia bacterium]
MRSSPPAPTYGRSSRRGAGVDAVDPTVRAGIAVRRVRSAHASRGRELAPWGMLALLRGTPAADRAPAPARWSKPMRSPAG